MKIICLLFTLLLITSCGKEGKTTYIESNTVAPQLDFSVDMLDAEDNYYFFLGVDGATYSNPATGTFGLYSNGGKALLGFPTEVSEYYPLSSSSTLSFFSQRMDGTRNAITLNLIVDSACDGTFNPAVDAMVSFTVLPNRTYTLNQTTPISEISGGSLLNVTVGAPFSSLIGRCLINTQITHDKMPDGLKLAGLHILVGDELQTLESEVSYEVSDVDIRF